MHAAAAMKSSRSLQAPASTCAVAARDAPATIPPTMPAVETMLGVIPLRATARASVCITGHPREAGGRRSVSVVAARSFMGTPLNAPFRPDAASFLRRTKGDQQPLTGLGRSAQLDERQRDHHKQARDDPEPRHDL